jgi:hypothetical protein
MRFVYFLFVPILIDATLIELYKEKLSSILENRERVTALAEEELREIPPGPSDNLVSYPPNTSNSFMGIRNQQLTKASFAAVWTELVVVDPPKVDECIELYLPYLKRPLWFIPSREDLIKTRECAEDAILSLSLTSQRTDLIPSADSLSDILHDTLPALFSVSSELAVRFPRTAQVDETRFSAWETFPMFVEKRPHLFNLLTRAISSIEPNLLPPTLTDFDREYFLKPDFHFLDFVDYHWNANSVSGSIRSILSLWMSLTRSPFEADDHMIFELSKRALTSNPEADMRNKLNMYQGGMGAGLAAWLRSVGSTLARLTAYSKDSIDACIPKSTGSSIDLSEVLGQRDLFYYLGENIGTLPSFYGCIVTAVAESRIVISDSDVDSVSTIMHMIRVGTSATALALDALK